MCSSAKNNNCNSCICLRCQRLVMANLVTSNSPVRIVPSSPEVSRVPTTMAAKAIKATNYSSMPQTAAALSDAKQKMIVVLISILAYINSSTGDFVHDDIPAIVNNPDVNGKNNIFQVLSNDFWGEPMASIRSHKSYRPLTILLFRLNYSIGQGQSWPFHGTNMILHGCATFFFGCICQRTLQLQNLASLMATLLFALHPIHTEAVSGIVGCADLLACNLTLLSFMAYTRYLVNPTREVKWHWLSLCFACGAVLSKETGIMALAINVGFGLYRSYTSRLKLRNTFKRLFWTDTLTLFVLLSIRMVVQNSSLPEFSAQDNPAAFHKSILTRTLSLLYLPVHNFWMMLCPSSLSYDWQMGSLPLITSVWDDLPRVVLALPLFYGTLLAGFMTIFYRNKSDSIVVAYLFLILPFLPASNLFFPVGFVVAERILYTPSIGFCLLVALGAERLLLLLSWNSTTGKLKINPFQEQQPQPSLRPTTEPLQPSLPSSCKTRSSSQSSMGSTSTTSSSKCGRTTKIRRRLRRARTRLRRKTASTTTTLSASNVETSYASTTAASKAGASATSAASARSSSSTNVYFLALLLSGILLLGLFTVKTWTRNYDWNSRRALFRSGLKTLPTNAKVHYNYANVLKEDGKTHLAMWHYRQALRLWPDYVLAHNNLATLLEDREEALHHLRMALNIDPWHPNSLYNMAVLHRERGDCSRAIPLLEKCISVEPNQERAYPLLADCLFSQNTTPPQPSKPPKHSDEPEKLTKAAMASTTSQRNTQQQEPNNNNDGSSFKSQDQIMPSEDNDMFPEANGKNSGLKNEEDQHNMASILSHLAEFYMGLEEWNKAEMALQRILNSEPQHDVALYQLSQVYLEQNRTRLALEVIRSASKNACNSAKKTSTVPITMPSQQINQPSKCIWGPKCTSKAELCAQIIIQEADILRTMRHYKQAVQRYRLALEMSPPAREGELLLNLGSVHHAMGEWDLAKAHYRQCLELEPDNPVVMDNMKLLGSQLYELKNH